MSGDRDYLQEARAILNGASALLPELAHLEALDQEHDRFLILLSQDLEQLKRKVLGA